jgi:hypothetical protein
MSDTGPHSIIPDGFDVFNISTICNKTDTLAASLGVACPGRRFFVDRLNNRATSSGMERCGPMWSQRKLITEEEREREIHRLEAVRDKLLDAAPKHFYFKRLLLPVMLAGTLIAVGDAILAHPAHLTFGHGLFLVGFLVLICLGTWKVWRSTPAPGDKWAFSDGLGYEGDSPRDIQRKIDALRKDCG